GLLVVGDFGGPNNLGRVTLGLLAGGKTAYGLSYGAEGYYQHGDADRDAKFRAYMVGGRLGFTFKKVDTKPFIKAFGDVLSGDDDISDGTARSFSTLFHTGHKFYGEMDYFLNLPLHTQQRGLVDVGASAGLSPAKPVKLSLTWHHFRAAASRDDGLEVFGNELGTKVTYQPWAPLKLDLFYGLFGPGDIFQAGVVDNKIEHFIYTTADVGF
ncbi:MAG TPA: hypothetical protein ENK23_05950, partial [Sorangium sp.]|nr:hypothetical protein [Sorangium sp.]